MAQKENEWQILSQKTQAKVSRSYMQNGESKTEQEEVFGTPEYVKQATGKKYQGESNQLEWVHTWTDLEREHHKNTTNGVTKIRETKTVQTYDFGNGEPVKTTTNPTGKVFAKEEDSKDPLLVEKFREQQDQINTVNDNLTNDRKMDRTEKLLMWVFIIGSLIIGIISYLLWRSG